MIALLPGGLKQTIVTHKAHEAVFVRRGFSMTIIQPALFSIIEQYPERVGPIKVLFKNNESFRLLCEDYRRCAEALQHWNQSLDVDAPARVREYKALMRELEDEILQNVNEAT